jgi:hypothetical protein
MRRSGLVVTMLQNAGRDVKWFLLQVEKYGTAAHSKQKQTDLDRPFLALRGEHDPE